MSSGVVIGIRQYATKDYREVDALVEIQYIFKATGHTNECIWLLRKSQGIGSNTASAVLITVHVTFKSR